MPGLPTAPRVTVVIVTWQGRHLLGPCLRSLEQQSVPHRVVVVDNASTDGTSEMVARDHPEVEVVRMPSNTGFAGAMAHALTIVDTPYTALLNNDATADPTWLSALVAHADDHPEAAAVTSCMLLDGPGDVLNNTGVLLLPGGYGADRGLGRPAGNGPAGGQVFGFSGGAALLRTADAVAVGGFPAPYFLYYEDTDLSWRLRLAGRDIRYEPGAVVRHAHSATVDQQSELFAFHNERNRLLTLVRCAPATMVVTGVLRFLLTTVSLAARRALGQVVPDVATFRSSVRLRAFRSFLALLPWALRSRGAVSSTGPRGRRALVDRWVGAEG